MAEQIQRDQQYQYTANASLVLNVNRSSLPRRDQEPSGEPETLYGRIKKNEFGDRAVRTIDEQKEKVEARRKAKEQKLKASGAERDAVKKSKKDRDSFARYGHSNILAATDDFEGETYRPRTRETRQTYELILTNIQRYLGDIATEYLRGAADEVLAILKDDSKKDFDKKKELEGVFRISVSSVDFSQLVNLSKKITDYNITDAAEPSNESGMARDQDLDEEYGVAVVFEEDDEDEDDDDEYEVKDAEDEDDEESRRVGAVADDGEPSDVLKTSAAGADDMDTEADNDDFTTVITAGAAKKQTKGAAPTEVLNPHDVDAFWLQRTVSTFYSDAHTAQEKTKLSFGILSSASNPRECENELMALFDFDKFELVKLLTRNRDVIVWCTRLARAEGDERVSIQNEMRESGYASILEQLLLAPTRKAQGESRRGVVEDAMKFQQAQGPIDPTALLSASAATVSGSYVPRAVIDLESMTFEQGGHLMSNKKCKLPEGTIKRSKKGYEEIHVPAPRSKPMAENEKLVPIASLPQWARAGFKGAEKLNRVQSQVYPIAFGEDENLLICAPTGAGKTNVAMLTILREIGKNMDEQTGALNLEAFKIVYIAPMKALVAEMVGNFQKRLDNYGIKVSELTGDRQLTKQQIAETQIIVTTPEKWDVITRKATDRSYTNLVRLIIIDEVHLLHDERGPVLESIISRTIRTMEQTQELVRLVGLSATLPNYHDVAAFMRVKPNRGLFYFDNSYRPCPLKQQYIGITEKKAIKRFQLMNEIAYEKVMEESGKNQILIFCHSRKETAKTAKTLRDMAIEKDTIGEILGRDAASREILQTEAATVKNKDLQDILPYGFAIHHAGMARSDRTLVEDLFAGGHVQVLVSTATLAWGVNLPAHTVIIKGTQVYSPEKGRWVELSPQDVLQMLGRAGRPQFDTHGEGIILTTHTELQYYLSLLNQQLPIESQFISKLADNMNAEIVLGNIRSREDAATWLGYTYLYVRMLRNPSLYNITPDDLAEDRFLEQKRTDLVHSAATLLDKSNLIRYDKKTGKFQVTELGRIASHYYVSHQSMAKYNQHLKPTLSLMDLFRIFALSEEFKFIPVREEEKLELTKMLERVPVPVKESIEEPTAKINVLLQAYISQLQLEGFALMSDMVYVTQSASRIIRAIFEICLKQGWAQLARKALDLCKMVDRRMWLSMNPLRQFRSFPADLIKRLESKEFAWDRYYDLQEYELGELAGIPKLGKLIHKFVHMLPKLEIEAHVQPITRSLLQIELRITPDFTFDEKGASGAESFWVLIEDVDGEQILYHDLFLLKERYATEEHVMKFTIPLYEPLPPNYFVSIVSDRWLHSETRAPVSFKHLILPEKYVPHTELLDLQPLPTAAFGNREFEAVYKDIRVFNPIQTQVFNSLYNSDDNVFVGAPAGSGKTICAEFALLRLWARNPRARCVYIAPNADVAELQMADWKSKFGKLLGGKNIVLLTGETTADLKFLEKGDIIFSTPEHWDMLSRRWKQRKNVQTIGLFIVDEVHLIGSTPSGPTIEVIVSRMRFINAQIEGKIRIVALGTSLANARDLGEWIGANSHSTFNFHPNVRPIPLEIHIQTYNIPHFASLMIAMSKPVFLGLTQVAPGRPAIVFVPSRKQCRLTAIELLTLCAAQGTAKQFLRCSEDAIEEYVQKIEDRHLAETVSYGVAFFHEALSRNDKRIVETLFESNAIQVVVASKDTCWGIRLRAQLVVIMGTQFYEGREHRYADYPIAEVLQMMGRATRPAPGESAKCILMCQAVKKDFYKKFLYEALPVESHLDHFLHDHFNAEVVTKTIENKQEAVDYLTWTFLYRRLTLNPNYYNLQGVTHRHISDYLSELVETTLEDLANSKCIELEDDNMGPLNLGMIAAYYYIKYETIELFSMSLTQKTKHRGLLEIIAAAAEYFSVPIRHHEDRVLKQIYDRLPVKVENPNFMDPHVKTNILLQAHFSRIQLPPDLESDQRSILTRVIALIQAAVDVISSNGWLDPAVTAMELSQMCVQAVWNRDSVLRQVPHLTLPVIERLKGKGVEDIFQLMEMDDDDRNQALGMDGKRMADIARFANRYPNIELSFDLSEDEAHQGDMVTLKVVLERDVDEDDENSSGPTDVGPVIAPHFPVKKDEGWWLVVGNPKDKTLLAIKRLTLQRKLTVSLDFAIPESVLGDVDFKLYFMCDSYTGVDQEYDLPIKVLEGNDAGEDDDDGDEGDDSDEEMEDA